MHLASVRPKWALDSGTLGTLQWGGNAVEATSETNIVMALDRKVNLPPTLSETVRFNLEGIAQRCGRSERHGCLPTNGVTRE